LNSLFTTFGLQAWKPLLAALLLPPVPLLVLVLFGARLILPRRGLGWLVVIVSVALLWLSTCTGTATLLSQFVLRPPAPMSSERIQALKAQARTTPTAIFVLGGGLEPFAPEYGVASLSRTSLERLRYGIWLSRETGLPLGFTGGIGWAQPDSKPEAQIAAQIAASEFGRPLKWVEDDSRDTRENARRTVALLRTTGIKDVVLVTHGWHMPRAVAAFEAAAVGSLRIEAAPMGLARGTLRPPLDWFPSGKGMLEVRNILHELLGRLAGA
jgi:uncharacterized SAM-binding protein YcdF (DUF218 family)